jgi:hypothetical protein
LDIGVVVVTRNLEMTVYGSIQAAVCALHYGFNAVLEVLLYFGIKEVRDNNNRDYKVQY